jgi:hypothetical protein
MKKAGTVMEIPGIKVESDKNLMPKAHFCAT